MSLFANANRDPDRLFSRVVRGNDTLRVDDRLVRRGQVEFQCHRGQGAGIHLHTAMSRLHGQNFVPFRTWVTAHNERRFRLGFRQFHLGR